MFNRRKRQTRRGQLPPGPPGAFFIGNLLQLSGDAWIQFSEWKNVYGPIFHLNLAGQDVVVLGNNTVAADLLDRRASIYSDRPRFTVAREILSEGLFFTFLPYGTIWRKMRRVGHERLHKGVVNKFHHIQHGETIRLLADLLTNPGDWENHVRRAVGSTVYSVAYATPPLKNATDSPLYETLEFTKDVVHAAYIDGGLVELFPWFRYCPQIIAPWKQKALKASVIYSELFSGWFKHVKESQVGVVEEHQCVAAYVAAKQIQHSLSDKEASWMLAALAAGSETMSGVLAWFFLAMIQHPGIQKKAQEEIDKNVGRNRLPSFSDYDHLQYIRAIIREVMRKDPVAPLGMQHRLTEDDFYHGYLIPKGTICIPNVW
ncbi:cytochrome P450 [Stereum hirsutum FP-91666 SS1]|uniref:Cytochrome P450 n=1 Tax=Stereum hirsutum (strain FP-91666) TaxID=721885 RepID=R7RWI9_STEHR|nr:cytochrome P450 [Stereum hirsutum FP-91666 SS1]EIM79123.1 cytochrome P450 [Stereum hirsutum FP-91666 SS1]